MMISGDFRRLTREEAEKLSVELDGAWKDESIPETQYNLAVKNEIEKYRNGAPCAPFSAFIQCLMDLPGDLDASGVKLLEVGASSGYYGEVMKIAGFKMTYEACDYSPAFQKLASKLYPDLKFHVADARELPFADASYDIVASGCVMIHVLDWKKIIKETARVTKKYALFHRTPISLREETEYFVKKAYDVPCIEIHYSEQEVMKEFTRNRLQCISRVQIFEDPIGKLGHYSYLLEKLT